MKKFAIGALLALTCAGAANAAVTFTSTAFDAKTPVGQTMVDSFDSKIASGFAFTGGNLETGSLKGYAAAPAQDASKYIAVYADQIATLTSAKALTSFGVYMGSIDSVNYIEFFDGATLVEKLTGNQLVAVANGDQKSGLTNRLFDFNLAGDGVNRVVFGSRSDSFEFDNLSARTLPGVPEPATWIMMLVGVGALGVALRRQVQASIA